MRPTPHPERPASEPAAGLANAGAGYDWSRFGCHRLRAPQGLLIDVPQSQAPPAANVATIWPDPALPGSWAGQAWSADSPDGRGWLLPTRLALGDVVRFATPAGGWHGIVAAYDDRAGWLTVQGPYPTAAHAHAHAQQLLALERYLPPVDADRPRLPRRPVLPRPSDGRPRRHRHRRPHP